MSSGGKSEDKSSAEMQTTSQQGGTLYPNYALPYASNLTQMASNVASTPYSNNSYYDAQGNAHPFDFKASDYVAPMNQMQTTALNNIYDYGTASNPLANASMSGLTDTVSGKYLDPNSNPFLAQYANQAMGDVSRNYMNSTVPQYSAAASRAGAFGGSADTLMRTEGMRNLGDTLSKTATGIYEPAYEAERNRMLQGTSLAPATMQMPLTLQTAALGAGDVFQQQNQKELNARNAALQQAQQWPFAALSGMAAPFQAYGWGNQTYGSGQAAGTSSSMTSENSGGGGMFGNILGTLGAVGGAFLGGPVGSAAGGAAGKGLGSLFG